jgi:hypothetical protein
MKMNPKFPIYIVSKGRPECLTAQTLKAMNVPYTIICDKDEVGKYNFKHGEENVLPCPQEYKDWYDEFWPKTGVTGAGAARNYAMAQSKLNGYSHHWVMDDNFKGFYRLNKNLEGRLTSGTGFKVMEDFVLRYDNIAQAGPNYEQFVKTTDAVPPFVKNTRIYSCILINNKIPFKWRGRYNEDTDLSLRLLKSGWATVQFNAFLADKVTTQRLAGGNHEQFYSKEGTKNKSDMLAEMHPDVAKAVWKFNRHHHTVDYKPFKNNTLGNCTHIPTGQVNNYGMKFVPFK